MGLPLLPEDSVKDNIERTREYGLILTVVQAVTRHERDLAEEQLERAEAERKKADNSTDSLPALAEEKKIKAGRRRARQDLRVSACTTRSLQHTHSCVINLPGCPRAHSTNNQLRAIASGPNLRRLSTGEVWRRSIDLVIEGL